MTGIFAWSCAIGYCIYLWKSRRSYTIDRVTILIACSLLLIATYMSM